MKNNMRDFIFLSAYYRDRPSATGPVADFIRTDAYRRIVTQMADNPKELARITIGLLNNLALDPLVGTRVEHFVNHNKPKGSPILFNLQFNRTANFIGAFSLDAGSPEAQQVLRAVEQNLASKMFKAAQVHRRLERKFSERAARITEKAKAAYEVAIDQARRHYDRNAYDDARRDAYLEARKVADKAYDDVYVPAYERLCCRIRRVAHAASSKALPKTASEMVAGIVALYIYPQYQQAQQVSLRAS